MTLRYEPGTAHAVARRRVVVLLPESHDPGLLASLWDRLGDEVGIVEVLQELTGAFGSDLRTVPPFAVVESQGDRVKVAVRGAMSVAVDRTNGDRICVDGREVSTWSERGIDDALRVIAAVGETPAEEPVADALLPLDAGIVLATTVSWVAAEHPGLVDAAASHQEPVQEKTPAPADDAAVDEPEPEALPVAADAAPANAAVLPEVDVDAEGDAGAEPVAEATDVFEGPATLAADSTAGHEVPNPAADAAARSETDAGADSTPALAAHGATGAVSPGPEPADEDDYGHLWGSTVLRTVEDAAVRAVDEAELAAAAPVPTAQPGAEAWDAEAWDAEARDVVDETPQDVTLAPINTEDDHDGFTMFSDAIADLRAAAGAPIDQFGTDHGAVSGNGMQGPAAVYAAPGSPVFGGPTAAGEYPASYGPAADADPYAIVEAVPYTTDVYGYDPSVDASAYGPPAPAGYRPGPSVGYNVPSPGGDGAPAPGAYGAPAAVLDQAEPLAGTAHHYGFAAGPGILARACSHGHANSPSKEVCAVCGSPLVGDAIPMPRPPLGRLVVSTGQVVDLDRDVVVGRRPRSVRGENDQVRLVTVPSPQQDISRSHLEITLEGWHVLLADLNTTNGTTLHRPGQTPRRLHPAEPTLMADGDVIDMGDGVTLTFAGLQ